jgi:hypothetical protein
MRLSLIRFALALICLFTAGSWGFFAHEKINRLAVFCLPPEMFGFFKKNIDYITDASVNPDRRRFFVVDEAPRHYLDIDHYGDSALYTLPRYWNAAVAAHSEDTLKAYGILPWHIHKVFGRLRDAFAVKDPKEILRLSAEIGHYLGDAHVPLHTTENYNGQLTQQEGIHALWESRLPELFSGNYDFFVGRPSYLVNPQLAAWEAVEQSHLAVDSVLTFEKKLASKFLERKYSFEVKGKQTLKVYSKEYAAEFHTLLSSMVERRMRCAVSCIASFWFTAWVDAGQPDLNFLIDYQPTEDELKKRREELAQWKQSIYNARPHESDHIK